MNYFSAAVKDRSQNIQRILLLFFVLETLCVSYALFITSLTAITSIVYTLSGIIIARCLLWMKPIPVSKPSFSLYDSTLNRYRWIILAAAALIMIRFSITWFADNPLNYRIADMLPIIKTMCERLLAGAWSHVYDPIPEIWHGTVPIYLPAMWMPFTLPVLLGTDIRWLTILAFLIVLAIFLWRTNPAQKNMWVLYACAFVLYWWLFENDKAGLVPFTEEGMVILYYVLLTIALTGKKFRLIAICTSLCVLSRYALIGWIPAMLIFFVYLKEWKAFLQFAVAGLGCFILFVLIPFGFTKIESILALPNSYIEFSSRVWRDSPNVFNESLGFAKFFGPQRISELHYLLVYLSFIIPALAMILVLILHRKKNISVSNIPLSVLKISLVVFYSLVDVPYLYLFYTSSFVSLFAVACFIKRNDQPAQP